MVNIFNSNYVLVLAATANELVFTQVDGIDYAFYNTKEKATLGYMRFQPHQTRNKKRAKVHPLVSTKEVSSISSFQFYEPITFFRNSLCNLESLPCRPSPKEKRRKCMLLYVLAT